MQGVSIGIFVRKTSGVKKSIKHAELYGLRKEKYERLAEDDISITDWNNLQPEKPFYLFIKRDNRLLPEYENGWKITEVMPINSVGIVTSRDDLAIHFSARECSKCD